MLIYFVLIKVRNCATKQKKIWQIISIIFSVLTENFYIVPFPCKFRFSFGGKFKFTKETLNYKKTRPLPYFHKIFVKKRMRVNISNFHNVRWAECGNFGNSLSLFFDKNFEKAMVLLNKLLKSWFQEIFFQWENFSFFSHCGESTVWKNEK